MHCLGRSHLSPEACGQKAACGTVYVRKAGKSYVGEKRWRQRVCDLVLVQHAGDLTLRAGVGKETVSPDLQGG